MKIRLLILSSLLLLTASAALSQSPSVQLKIRQKSGFLGMGGPRIVELRLSNEKSVEPLTDENVNGGKFYYFLCTPAADWQIDPDFVNEDLSRIVIVQKEQKVPIGFTGSIVTDGQSTSLLFGFPKALRLNESFSFQIQMDDSLNIAELNVPMEFWPGYGRMMGLWAGAQSEMNGGNYRVVNAYCDSLLADTSLAIFPRYAESREMRTNAFNAILNDDLAEFQRVRGDSILGLKEKIARVEGFRPSLMYVRESLPLPQYGVAPSDPHVSLLLDRAAAGLNRIDVVRDSLQKVLDDRNVRWILEGSATGINGLQYQLMIEALAYACSDLAYADTLQAELKPVVSPDIRARLEKQNLAESFETFVRMTNERCRNRQPMFAPEFLASVRRDSASFALPFFAMLRTASDYYAGNLDSCKAEIFSIFRTCYDGELLSRFDDVRVLIDRRLNRIPAEAVSLIDAGRELEGKRDPQTAGDKYHQATVIAPTFAYAPFVLGKFYVRNGEPVRAITFFQKAYQLDSLYLSAYRESYILYRKQGNFKPMIDVLELALAKGNDYWETNAALGQAFMGDGDPARAIERYKRALELNPRSYQTNIQLGQAYQTVKDYQKAREYFNRAIEIDALRQEAVDALNRLNELERSGR